VLAHFFELTQINVTVLIQDSTGAVVLVLIEVALTALLGKAVVVDAHTVLFNRVVDFADVDRLVLVYHFAHLRMGPVIEECVESHTIFKP